jgi:hypothetical protein
METQSMVNLQRGADHRVSRLLPRPPSHAVLAVQDNGYQLLYLSSRPVGMAGLTRWYLRRLCVGGHSLPHGPVLVSSDGLVPALHRELVLRLPHHFKIRWAADFGTPRCRGCP